MRTHLLQSIEMEKNAVMAQTDEESQDFANQSFVSSAAVEQDLNEALKSLAELSGIVGKESGEALLRANTAFSDFLEVTAKVIILSRQNSNVKSLELSLGRKRKTAAQCDEILSTFQNIAHDRTFKATR